MVNQNLHPRLLRKPVLSPRFSIILTLLRNPASSPLHLMAPNDSTIIPADAEGGITTHHELRAVGSPHADMLAAFVGHLVEAVGGEDDAGCVRACRARFTHEGAVEIAAGGDNVSEDGGNRWGGDRGGWEGEGDEGEGEEDEKQAGERVHVGM